MKKLKEKSKDDQIIKKIPGFNEFNFILYNIVFLTFHILIK